MGMNGGTERHYLLVEIKERAVVKRVVESFLANFLTILRMVKYRRGLHLYS